MDGRDPPRKTATRPGVRTLLRQLGVQPSKARGQNFLTDPSIVSKMVRALGVTPNDLVLEVGPGLGMLTEALLARAGHVIALEVDPRLARYLEQEIATDHFTLVPADALTADLSVLVPTDQPYLMAANLPYSIAAAVVRRFLEAPNPPQRMAVMVQREVAERMVAAPPEMSILGIAVQLYANARVAFTVPPSVFVPQPTVESAVVVLELHQPPLVDPREAGQLFQILNAGFRQKRKKIANSLAAELKMPKDDAVSWLRSAEIDPDRRAQTLSVGEWLALLSAAPQSLS